MKAQQSRQPRLVWRGRLTWVYVVLKECASEPMSCWQPGDWNPRATAAARCVECGWLIRKATGPQGGGRWHLTSAGRDALAAAGSELQALG
jgi:hypothetical protein